MMKTRFIWAILFVLCLAIVLLGLAVEVAESFQATPTAIPSSSINDSAEYDLRWTSLGGPYERVAYGLAIDTQNSRVYLGTWGHGVYWRKIPGDTWRKRGAGGGRFIKALDVLPSNPSYLYAGTFGDGLFRSTDRGVTWEQLGSFSDFTYPSSPTRNPLLIESILIVGDLGTERIFVGTRDGVWSSEDLGEKWNKKDEGFADTDEAYSIQSLVQDSTGGFYAGTLDGLYQSRDQGESWQRLEPPDDYPDNMNTVLSLAVITGTSVSTDLLLVGTKGAGIFALDIASGTWSRRNTGFPDDIQAHTIQALLNPYDKVVYAGTVNYGVFESLDAGQSWQQISDGLPLDSRSILSLAYDSINDVLYTGTFGDGVYQLSRKEKVWQPANQGHPVGLPVQEIAFCNSESKALLAALKVGGIYSSTNQHHDAPTWSSVPQALPIGAARDVADIVVSGPNRNIILIASGAGIFRSEDGGEKWTRLGCEDCDDGLPKGNINVKALTRGRQNSNIHYAVVAGYGFYYSDDSGTNWQSIPIQLSQDKAENDLLLYGITSLAVGSEDEVVYLGLDNGRVFVTRDAGLTWSEPKQVSDESPILELDWTQRHWLDVFLYGGDYQALYARVRDGIYVSYDDGHTWQLRLRGYYNTMLADPHRPWVVYVASPQSVLDKEYELEAPLKLTPDLWISYDQGKTWKWAGPGPTLSPNTSPASFTTLAFDPDNEAWLYAGTEGTGIFRATLPQVNRPFSRMAFFIILTLAILSFIALILLIYILVIGLTLGRRYQLIPRTWPKLTYFHLMKRTDLGRLTEAPSPLPALGCLVLAIAPSTSFTQQTIEQELEDIGASTIPDRLKETLNSLIVDYHFLSRKDNTYRLVSSLFGQIAKVRFWQDESVRQEIIDIIRNESLFRQHIQKFLNLSGFTIFPFDFGFKVISNQPEYTLLGADQGIFVYLYPGAELDEEQMIRAKDNASRAYDGQLAGKIALLAVQEPPSDEVCELIKQWRQDSDFRLVILSLSKIGDTETKEEARQQFDIVLRRNLGNEILVEYLHSEEYISENQ